MSIKNEDPVPDNNKSSRSVNSIQFEALPLTTPLEPHDPDRIIKLVQSCKVTRNSNKIMMNYGITGRIKEDVPVITHVSPNICIF